MRTTPRAGPSVTLALCGALAASACGDASDGPWIAEGQSEARIVPAIDDDATRHAAAELQRYLAEATGVTLPIAAEPEPGAGPEFVVGWGAEAKAAAPDLAPDAFVWLTPNERRRIIGGPGEGTLYGVYAFLEEHLGIRRYTPQVTRVPKRVVFDPPSLSETRSPAFPIRWVHLPGAEAQDWCDWQGVHPRAHRDKSWGMFVHTFERLVPPDDHFEEHPEYFSLIRGKRLPTMQLCLTNEDVFRLVVAGLRARMAERPEARLWSVSQNDRNGACECAACSALVEKHGSQAGPLLAFVNRVAAEFPDHVISTLAYSYTRRPPVDLEPAPNVSICLCSIECDRSAPLTASESGAEFVRDMEAWSALTDDLMIWDYVVQFSNYVSPFPNFSVLQPNIQLFRDRGVKRMFQQGSGTSRSDLSDLKQYVIAKLLWDPDLDVDALIDDFLSGVYGAAAPHLRCYLDLLHARLETSGAHLSIYGSPAVQAGSWLTPATLGEADAILEKAEQAVAERPEEAARVREIRLSVTFARLEQGKRFGDGEHGLFEAAPEGGWRVLSGWETRLEDFVAGCETSGIERIRERPSPPVEYGRQTRRFLSEGMVAHLGVGCPVRLSEPPSPKYPANGVATLTDGVKGTDDYHYGWLGWEAVDAAATVDLGETKPIRRLAADFLQVAESWIWLPVEVRWLTSTDGEAWEVVSVRNPNAPATRLEPFVERFACDAAGRAARFVRLEAKSRRHCPDWHQGAGGDAWIFCDEVMVFE